MFIRIQGGGLLNLGQCTLVCQNDGSLVADTIDGEVTIANGLSQREIDGILDALVRCICARGQLFSVPEWLEDNRPAAEEAGE